MTVKQAPLAWLDEANRYIGIKEIPGPAHNKTIIGWLTRLGAWWKDDETPWCLGPETEVLTNHGFVKFKDFAAANPDKVAQFNVETGNIEYVEGYEYIEKPYDGEVYVNTKLGLLADPKHRFFGKWHPEGDLELRPIESITEYGIDVPSIRGVVEDSTLVSDDELRQMATKNFPNELMDWTFVLSLSARQCRLFIDTYKHEECEAFTVLPEAVEVFTYITTMAGYKATPFDTEQLTANGDVIKTSHVHISPNIDRRITTNHLVKEPYKGRLYCLQVPSQVFIIRTEVGVIMPIGNCGVFTAHCLSHAGRPIPKYWMRAKDYLNWGSKLTRPAYGCIAVTGRQGGGHVFFVVGKTRDGRIVGLGGNQSNAVNLRAFPASSILGYRWPPHKNGVPSIPYETRYNLPIYDNNLAGVTSMA